MSNEETFHKIMALRSRMNEESKKVVDKKIKETLDTLSWELVIRKYSMCWHCRNRKHQGCFSTKTLECECPVCYPKD